MLNIMNEKMKIFDFFLFVTRFVEVIEEIQFHRGCHFGVSILYSKDTVKENLYELDLFLDVYSRFHNRNEAREMLVDVLSNYTNDPFDPKVTFMFK